MKKGWDNGVYLPADIYIYIYIFMPGGLGCVGDLDLFMFFTCLCVALFINF